jgi:hypothetical protein
LHASRSVRPQRRSQRRFVRNSIACMRPSEWSFLNRCEQPTQAKIEARHYINEPLGANQTLAPSHGENRGSSPLGSANDFNKLLVG